MPAWRPIRLLIALIILGALLWKIVPMPSRTITFEEQNCSCKIPYNWKLKDNPLFTIEAHRFFGGTFCMTAKPAPPSLTMETPAFEDGVKSQVQTDGFEILSENHDPFQGHPAYSYTMRKVINGKNIYTHSINFVAEKFLYDLVTAKANSDPVEDAQLKAVVDSFSLLNPASP
jgi:hypothetical protein